jgi:hypothetical protein
VLNTCYGSARGPKKVEVFAYRITDGKNLCSGIFVVYFTKLSISRPNDVEL